MMPTAEYIAGFFDGEGLVGLYYAKRDSRWCPEVAITQKSDSRTMLLMRRIAERYHAKVKYVNGGYLALSIRRKDRVREFIRDVLPFCTVKHTQLLVLDAWLETGTYSYRTAQLLKTLKRRA